MRIFLQMEVRIWLSMGMKDRDTREMVVLESEQDIEKRRFRVESSSRVKKKQHCWELLCHVCTLKVKIQKRWEKNEKCVMIRKKNAIFKRVKTALIAVCTDKWCQQNQKKQIQVMWLMEWYAPFFIFYSFFS